MSDGFAWATEYPQRAREEISDGQRAFEEKRFPTVVVRAAASIEYSVKAALYLIGEVPPEEHRDYAVLRKYRGRFPKGYRDWVEVWAHANETTQRSGAVRFGEGATAIGALSWPGRAQAGIGTSEDRPVPGRGVLSVGREWEAPSRVASTAGGDRASNEDPLSGPGGCSPRPDR
jgi:HEPN domain-containing protein